MSIIERSQLINDDENNRFMSLIELKCKILYFTVARLYQTFNNEWRHLHTGLIALTKDNSRKKYFLELYNMDNWSKCWEQIIPFNFTYNVFKKQIHTFTSDDAPTLLSFASYDESHKFSEEIQKLLLQRKEQKDAKKRQSQMNNQYSTVTDSVVEIKPAIIQETKNITNKKGKISKNDISIPTNFRHVDHMGLHDHFFENPENEQLRNFLKSAKMENLLDNADAKREIYEFIDQRGGLKKLESEMRQQQLPTRKAPPVPQKVPPPPPGRIQPAQLPKVQQSGPMAGPGHMAPPPPPSSAGAPPPPPPPPPPPAPAPPTINFAPKPTTTNALQPPTGKVGLLAEIEKFDSKKLKARSQAEQEEVSAPAPAVGGSLLDSLAQYLVQRKTLLDGRSDSEASDDNDEDEEDWKD